MTTSNPNPNPNPTTERAGQAWQDTTLPYATRVDLLLAQMTVEEKVGQLGSRWIGNDMRDAGNADAPADVAPMQKVFAGAGAPPLEESSRYGLGHLLVECHLREEEVDPGGVGERRVLPPRRDPVGGGLRCRHGASRRGT